jgi:hemerythrin-like metal-binding protein
MEYNEYRLIPTRDFEFRNFAWTERYSVHVEDMDTQHRRLGALVDSLIASLSSGDTAETNRRFDMLAQYVEIHFGDEEQFMRENGYPHVAAHAQLHQSFREQLAAVRDCIRDGGQLTASDLSNALLWLETHLLSADREYGEYFRHRSL